jgi:type VI secretion system secreted protein Hcp
MKIAIILLTMGLIAVGPSCFAATDSPNSNGGTIQSSGDPIYMQYGSISGASTGSPACTGIQLNSFQWGVGRGISSPTGGSADREASAPSVSEIVVTKSQDVSSTKLLYDSFRGIRESVHIDFCKTGDNSQGATPYLSIDLTNALVTGISWSTSSGDENPNESISFNFEKIQWKDVPTGIAVSYDVLKHTATLITPPPPT